MDMPIKTEREVRVALFVSPEIRDMVNVLARLNQRGQRNQIEYMVKKEYRKITQAKVI